MRVYVLSSLLLVVVVLSIVEESESRSQGHSRASRQRSEARGRGKRGRAGFVGDEFHNMMGNLRNRWGGRHSFNFGNGDPFGFDLDFGWGFGGQRHRQWFEGPNVCQSVTTDNSTADAGTITHHYKTVSQVCEDGDTAYTCTTKIQSTEGSITKIEVQECCHGFTRKPGDFGCPKELRLVNLPKTAEKLGLNDLLRAVATAELTEELTRGNFTVFAPKDGSFSVDSGALPLGPGITLQDMPKTLVVSEPLKQKMENHLQAVLLGHLITEPRRASSFRDEEVLETGSPYDSTIRINFYSRPEKLTTANCVPVTSTDNIATNGVIHVVDKVLPTVTSSLMELIQRDKDLSFLKTALAKANLVSTLQKDGQFTLFAPTNAAFQRLDRTLLDKLLNGDQKCLDKVVKQHILPHVICATVIQGRAKSPNLLSNYINLTRNEDNKLFVDVAQIVRSDIMATNGVMHIIDAVLIPADALDLLTAAQENGLTELVNLVETAGLSSTLQNASNVTVFAPTNAAFQALPEETAKQLTSDPALLQSVLSYHVVPQEMTCRQMTHNLVLDTLNAQAKIRVNEYHSFPFGNRRVLTVQCAPVLVRNVPACNGLVHIIDKVLIPPSGNVVDVLAADRQYSTLVRLVKIAGLADSLQGEGPFTVFAPNNKAFERLGKDTMRDLESNQEKLTEMIKLHVFEGDLCCAGIFPNPWWNHQRVTTLSGDALFVSRGHNGNPHVDSAYIDSCDNMATNGIVHGIDEVLLPRPDPWYMFP